MKNRLIHQNLDTSFVNLSALIKYLRRRQFVGSINIQLNGYKADIELQRDNQMKVSEHDQISGRISNGEEALQRVLIRAREAGGSINVYQSLENESINEIQNKATEPKVQRVEKELKEETILDAEIIQPAVKPFQPTAPKNGNAGNGLPKLPTNGLPKNNQQNGTTSKIIKDQEAIKNSLPKKKEKSLPDFPFSLTNKVEAKAKPKEISPQEWQMILKLTVEILTVVDKTLATEKLTFSAAFRKACSEVADDYPFLNPSSGTFVYSNGRIQMTEKVNEKIFITSIMEALRRILEKLESNPKFKNLHRHTTQTLIALMNKRKSHYDKFLITPHFKRILGI